MQETRAMPKAFLPSVRLAAALGIEDNSVRNFDLRRGTMENVRLLRSSSTK
jgi:hypothetical protein